MSKGKALAYTILLVVLAVICFPTPLWACGWVFFIPAVVLGAVAFSKHKRDTNIIVEAEQEQIIVQTQLPMLPPMSSKGSSRLFVPPPIDRRS